MPSPVTTSTGFSLVRLRHGLQSTFLTSLTLTYQPSYYTGQLVSYDSREDAPSVVLRSKARLIFGPFTTKP